MQVLLHQGRENADLHHSSASGLRQAVERFKGLDQLGFHATEWRSRQGDRGRIVLEIEAVQFQLKRRIEVSGQHGSVNGIRTPFPVHNGQFHFGAQRLGTGPEPGTVQQIPEHDQTFLQTFGKQHVIRLGKCFSVD
ncbi:MAG: hypothetical protein OXB94_00725 [Nitrospira sp.]|nr:hypothetical protein [Nitrospira sp.]